MKVNFLPFSGNPNPSISLAGVGIGIGVAHSNGQSSHYSYRNYDGSREEKRREEKEYEYQNEASPGDNVGVDIANIWFDSRVEMQGCKRVCLMRSIGVYVVRFGISVYVYIRRVSELPFECFCHWPAFGSPCDGNHMYLWGHPAVPYAH